MKNALETHAVYHVVDGEVIGCGWYGCASRALEVALNLLDMRLKRSVDLNKSELFICEVD